MATAGGIIKSGKTSVHWIAAGFLTAGLLFAPCRARAQDQVQTGAPANWVAPLAPDWAAAQAPAQPGVSIRWLLRDEQIHAALNQIYGHLALQVLTSAGVQSASQIHIDFDPAYETLTLHSVSIRREGKTLDRLDRNSVRVIQRELGLEDFIFTGEKTAVIPVSDVRPGDVLDYAYTLTGNNPSLRNHWFLTLPALFSNPVARLRTRVLWPPQRKLYAKNYLIDASPAVARKGDLTEYVWGFANVPGLPLDDSRPIWYDPYPSIQLSEYHLWAEVNQWALQLFTNTAPISPELKAQLAEWRASRNQTEATAAALRFVQEEIRYLGDEGGPGAYTPSAPATVFERRFGDCKDKAFLLVTILRELGVPAYPVLVNTSARQQLADLQPSPTDFNHVIVLAGPDGNPYWLDATQTYQRGPLGTRGNPPFAYGLVIRPGTVALTPIPPAAQPLTTVTEYFQIPRPPTPITLKVVTVAEGAGAASLREFYATTPREQIDSQNLDYFAKFYPRIKRTAPSVFTDNDAANIVEVDDFFRLEGQWTMPTAAGDLFATFMIRSHNVDASIHLPGISPRTMPLATIYPRHEIFKVVATVEAVNYIAPDDQWIRNPAFLFHRAVNLNGPTLSLFWEYQSLMDYVPVAAIPQYVQQLQQASDLLDFPVQSYPAPQ